MSEAVALQGLPETLNPADPKRYSQATILPIFERMRAEAPVHYCADSPYGPFWSLTRYHDIMAVDKNHEVFSSAANLGGIIIDDGIVGDEGSDFFVKSFITMDPPEHGPQRKAVNRIVAPPSLANFESLIRTRTQTLLDSLPVGEEFDWVDRVSIELTTTMLATLFDFPFEDRRKLTRWSDVTTAEADSPIVGSMPVTGWAMSRRAALRTTTPDSSLRTNKCKTGTKSWYGEFC
jgi:cytochrome P450